MVFESIDNIAAALAELEPPPPQTFPVQQENHHFDRELTQHNYMNVKLPNIQIGKFSGKLHEWQTFGDTFISSIKNNHR